MTDWCILRTSGHHTLPLVKSLTQARLEVWTPTLRFKRRLPRTKAEVDAYAPLMPQYVFARSRHFDELLALERGRLQFSMFRCLLSDGQRYFPFVADRELDDLRSEDYRFASQAPKPKPKSKPRHYHHGEIVTVPDGAWAGMSGVVERTKGKYVIVSFDQKEITVATWKLDEAARQAA